MSGGAATGGIKAPYLPQLKLDASKLSSKWINPNQFFSEKEDKAESQKAEFQKQFISSLEQCLNDQLEPMYDHFPIHRFCTRTNDCKSGIVTYCTEPLGVTAGVLISMPGGKVKLFNNEETPTNPDSPLEITDVLKSVIHVNAFLPSTDLPVFTGEISAVFNLFVKYGLACPKGANCLIRQMVLNGCCKVPYKAKSKEVELTVQATVFVPQLITKSSITYGDVITIDPFDNQRSNSRYIQCYERRFDDDEKLDAFCKKLDGRNFTACKCELDCCVARFHFTAHGEDDLPNIENCSLRPPVRPKHQIMSVREVFFLVVPETCEGEQVDGESLDPNHPAKKEILACKTMKVYSIVDSPRAFLYTAKILDECKWVKYPFIVKSSDKNIFRTEADAKMAAQSIDVGFWEECRKTTKSIPIPETTKIFQSLGFVDTEEESEEGEKPQEDESMEEGEVAEDKKEVDEDMKSPKGDRKGKRSSTSLGELLAGSGMGLRSRCKPSET